MNHYQADLAADGSSGALLTSQIEHKSMALLLAYADLTKIETSVVGSKGWKLIVSGFTQYDLTEFNEPVKVNVKSQNSRKSPVGNFKATYSRGDYVIIYNPSNEVRGTIKNVVSILDPQGNTIVLMGNITDTQSEISNVLVNETAFILNS